MDKTVIYTLAVAVGAGLGIISMVSERNKKRKKAQEDRPEQETPHHTKDVKEFALHHFNEIKKLNPAATLDTIPESIFPEELKKLLREGDAPTYSTERVAVKGNDLFITNSSMANQQDVEIRPVLRFEKDIPVINVYENGYLYRSFTIDPKAGNDNLAGQYFHTSVRVNANSSVQIDGIISKSESNPDMTDYEGIRFQPFFLSDKSENNRRLEGKGMFERGLHYSGIISSGNIRLICICDSCLESFSVGFIHAGFSEVQYFYSENSKETLLVPYDAAGLGNLPTQLQTVINDEDMEALEANLPEFEDGKFRYYNSFKCPHCNSDYINFRENKEIRAGEYYANYYLNRQPVSYK